MQALVSASNHTSLRVGDLAWLARHSTHRELAPDIRLWEADGALVAWAFARSNGGFNLLTTADAASGDLFDRMLDFVADAARAAVAAGDPPVDLYTYGIVSSRSPQDRALAEALERRGFHPSGPMGGTLGRRLDEVERPTVPSGYTRAAVRTAEHLIGRVEAHRAAFAPSELTVGAYRRVRRAWPYREDLDRVVVDDTGTVVAFCTAWLDEEQAAGLLEPVGVHPAHQRRGLGRAVCLDALGALHAAGAETAQVGYLTEAALATYRSIGFEAAWPDSEYRKAASPPS
jgi:predicted N-acetyltransferase YhbS